MLRFCVVLLAFLGSPLAAQSRAPLLQRVADRFENANSFSVKGVSSAALPGSSWRVAIDFETEGAQPAFLPLNARGPSIEVISTSGKATETRIRADAHDPKPQRNIMPVSMGRYNELAQHLIEAQQVGTETVTVQGRTHRCEIIAATYDDSPQFKPHSKIRRERYWIDPADLLVVREMRSGPEGLQWTADVTSTSFDQPPSKTMVDFFKRIAAGPKDRPQWIGRPVPDLTLSQLGGASVNLRKTRGQTVLLDFWNSYCGPCTIATRHAQDLENRYRSSGFRVLTLTQDSAHDAKLWSGHYHVNLPILLDPNGAAFRAFDVHGVPVTILIGADGKVVHYWIGLEDPAQIDSIVSATLQAQPGVHSSSGR